MFLIKRLMRHDFQYICVGLYGIKVKYMFHWVYSVVAVVTSTLKNERWKHVFQSLYRDYSPSWRPLWKLISLSIWIMGLGEQKALVGTNAFQDVSLTTQSEFSTCERSLEKVMQSNSFNSKISAERLTESSRKAICNSVVWKSRDSIDILEKSKES